MSYDPVQVLSERFAAAIVRAFPQAAGADPMIAAGRNPKFGDFQCNAAMGLARTVGKPPREVAKTLIGAVDLSGIAEPLSEASIAGPGFINITLRAEALAGLLRALDMPGLGIEPEGAGRTVVVDLCGVNLAKQMHVGHLRATIIGDSLARVIERLGFKVVRQNHVGDWGLPIAMVTDRLMRLEAEGTDTGTLTLDGLEKIYRAAQAEAEASPEAMERAKGTLLRLQNHDPEVGRVWQRVVDITMGECLKTCARLHTIVRPEDSAGESSYAGELAGLVADLVQRGVAEESEGALVVRVEGFEEPCIVRKRDGAFLYATTDLAGIRRRVQNFGAERVVYAVDARQSLHFKLVFGAAVRAGYATRGGGTGGSTAGGSGHALAAPAGKPPAPPIASLEHAAFGTVLGEDHKPFKTRSGENVKLTDLIDESVARAERVVAEKNPDLPADERRSVAEAVGVAAIKYADLSNDRIKDYVFSFDRMLAFEGNTGPYLLYALVRVRRIFAEAAERGIKVDPNAPLVIGKAEEKALALALLRFPGVVRSVASSLEPHRLCGYLYELAQAYSTFYNECHVLNAPDEATRQSRLHLCRLVERVMGEGLGLLGIPTLQRM